MPTIPSISPFQPDASESWCWQEALGLVNSLNDVFFLDERVGWAVGEHGTILHTYDGGNSWQHQISPVDTDLRRVVFVDTQRGWIIGVENWYWDDRDALLRTTDGGQTWVESIIPFERLSFSTEMVWVDANTGWWINGSQVFRTIDGGETWREQVLLLDGYLNSITSVDAQHAWIASGRTILRTTDGGQSWVAHEVDRTTETFYVQALAFVDTKIGWGVSRDSIVHTIDGGQTWEVQFDEINVHGADIDFLDSQIGWVMDGDRGKLWQTTDGGNTWMEIGETPSGLQAIDFVDARRGWAAGRLSWNRSTIVHTEDGGATWQAQDTNIEMPPLAYTSVARFTPYLAQRDPSLEILLVRLLPAPCGYEEYGWVLKSLHNLGWLEDDQWGNPLLASDIGYQDISFDVHLLDADMDNDGVDEIVLYGGGDASTLVVGVLDWDGIQWQVAWFDLIGTQYGGIIEVRLEDLNADAQPELFVETLTHPGSGTGFLSVAWDFTVVECDHLHCDPLWSETLGSIVRAWGSEFNNWYDWTGSDRRLVGQGENVWPEIELQEYGVSYATIPTGDPLSSTFEVQVLTTTQTVFGWDGSQYTPTAEIALEPSYVLDTRPFTETIDLDGNGIMEQAVHRRIRNGGGLWQELSVYTRDGQGIWKPTQVFTAAFTGSPSAGIFLRDVDDDDQVEIVECKVSFNLQLYLPGYEWPSMQPHCTVYDWDSVTREFIAQTSE